MCEFQKQAKKNSGPPIKEYPLEKNDVLLLAYERTCINTGGFNWRYMNTILTRWQEAGLHTLEQIKNGDRKPAAAPKGASGKLGEAELAAIQRALQEV